MPYVLALDSGTTSARAIVFDHDGAIRAVAQKEFAQHLPPARAGSSTTRWKSGPPRSASPSRPSAGPGCGPKDVAAVGITNQRETTVVWDRQTGEPVCNAIVWQDRRTAAFCDQLRADGHEQLIRDRTGLVIDAYFSGSKVAWILDNVPGARREGRGGQARVRHRRHLARLEADRRQAARHRPEQRLADDALQHPHAASGTTSC